MGIAMAAVQVTTAVPIRILDSQREQARADSEWRQSAEHSAFAHRAIPDDVEKPLRRMHP
jgi:hypothetical protein